MKAEASSEAKVSRAVNLFDSIIKWALVLGVALVPIIVIPTIYDSYYLPKAILLYILTLMVVFAYLARSLLMGKIVIRRTPLNKPLGAMAIVATIATLASPVPFVSIFGEYGRYMNLPTIYSLSILCFMATQFMYQKEWLNNFMIATLTSFGLISIHGIVQNFGFDVLQHPLMGEPGRSVSTFGNSVFFGGYIALMLPLILSFLIDEEKSVPLPKTILGVLIVLGLAGVTLSQTRGAWLGVIIGIFATLLLHRKRFLKGISTSIALAIFALAFLLLVMSIAGPSVMQDRVVSIKERMTSATDLSSGSAATRIEIWKSAINMIGVRPFLGYGPDQMYLWSPAFKTLRMAQIEKNTIPDKAHNELLQQAIDGGSLYLLVFLWITVILVFAITRMVRENNSNRSYIIAITAALIGYLAQGISGISIVGIAAPAYIFAGTIVSSYKNQATSDIEINFKTNRHVELIALAAMIITIIALLSFKPIVADTYYLNGHMAKQYSKNDEAIIQFNGAVQMYPYQSQYRRELGFTLLDQGRRLENAPLVEEAVSIAEQGLSYNKHDYDLFLVLAIANRIYASITNEMPFVSQAETYYSLAVEKNPLSTNPRRGLLGLLLIQEKYDDVIVQAKQILQIDPGDADVRYRLAQAYEKTGKYGRAKRIYKELIKLYPNRSDIRDSLKAIEQ